MTPLEGETVIAGSYSLAAIAIVGAFVREAFKRNWVRLSFSFGVTTPEARLLKPLKKKQPASDTAPVESPVPISDSRRSA